MTNDLSGIDTFQEMLADDSFSDANSDSETQQPEETAKEARVRKAREAAKRDYLVPQIDSDRWYWPARVFAIPGMQDIILKDDMQATASIMRKSFWDELDGVVNEEIKDKTKITELGRSLISSAARIYLAD